VPSERECPRPTCIIAGAGPGLGLAVAERYAREGFAVYALSQRPARLAAGIARLQMRGLHVTATKCEIGKPCDVLIYNAFVENSHGANVESASAFVTASVKAMRVKGCGAVVLSTYECAQAPLLRTFARRLAQEAEAFGTRVGVVTIEGTLPASRTKLTSIADVYWELFFSADVFYQGEVRVRTDLPRKRERREIG
jgi:NAD(P)-dependent dehydrogenase (short-subunit alcohol dehydrogenase family)